jgi:uncharacterized protein (DUF849 family)
MSGKTILTCAVTGSLTTLQQHPGIPCTPEQIANSTIEAAKAGAAVAHIHVRYPNGSASMEIAHYREVMDRIRDSGTDIIINLTTGPGGRFIPSDDDPKIAAPGTSILHPLKRVEHIVELKPDISTLDLNTMYSGTSVVINTPQNLKIMAKEIRAAGVMPELEVFDSGDIHLARALLADGTLARPTLFQIVMGVRYGFSSSLETLLYARSQLPSDAIWAAFAIGRWAFPMLAATWMAGGHIRIGLEDAVQISRGKLAPSNAAMVEKAIRMIHDMGGEVATPKEARSILGLKG